jgi:arylsulfatase A-like enzyme
MVESIDLAATFVDLAGGSFPDHILEGRSLVPLLHGQSPEWRTAAISEYTYAVLPIREVLGVSEKDARLFMVRTKDWKLIHAEGGFRPILFDLKADPEEFFDLGDSADHQSIIDELYAQLFAWARRDAQRVTRSSDDLDAMRGKSLRRGILPFLYDPSEVSEELTEKYRGPAGKDYTAGD